MEVNSWGILATVLFIALPSAFLIILYAKTASQQA